MTSRPSPTNLFTSTLLVTNIHCPSCVSYANDVLSSFSDCIHQIDTSIVDHTIRVQHSADISEQLAQELVGAAFEVENVVVTNSQGDTVREFDVQPPRTALPNSFLQTLFMSKAQKQHIKNCNSCREQGRRINPARRSWADVLRIRRTSGHSAGTDVERGILRSASLQSEQQTTNYDEDIKQDDGPGLYVVTFTIEGMTCASCVAAVTNGLKEHEYVQSANVNLVANSASVTFCGLRGRANDLKEAIEDIGYDAEIQDLRLLDSSADSPKPVSVSLAVAGMTCGSCVGVITRGLRELPFVQKADVDLLKNSANVVAGSSGNIDEILEKISDLGYTARIVNVEPASPTAGGGRSEERSVQIQLSGMYCPQCPAKFLTAIKDAFPTGVTITHKPTLKAPRLGLAYRPSLPDLTIRRIIDVLNSVDPACSASIYHPPTVEERSREIQRRERNRILRHLFVTLVIAIPSFIIGVVYMSLVPANNTTRRWFEEPIWAGNAMRIDWALFVMTTPAMFYGASLFHIRALKEIWSLWRPRSKVPILRRFYRFGSMNLLISAGTAVAYFASLAVLVMDATSPRQGHGTKRKSTTYFDTVTFLTLFILIGRFLEAYSKAKTGDAVSMLANLRPSTALLVESKPSNNDKQSTATITQISADQLEVGDTINIPYGAYPPADCTVAQNGNFLFDESSLTGESRPVKKSLNDKIFTGSMNVGNPVQVIVNEIGGKSVLDQIVKVVREGQAKRAPIERLADTLTGYFTPVITLLAIITWVVWLVLGESKSLPQGWLDVERGGWPYWSVEFAIAVFVVACPCGIGLAAPTALFVGGGLAAKSGILVQGGGEAFQEASRLDTIVFDKTGTLTEGRMKVTETELLKSHASIDRSIIFAAAKALEEVSTHPIAKAIVKHCDEELQNSSTSNLSVISIKEISGQGMLGRFKLTGGDKIETYEALIGSERLLSNEFDSSPGQPGANIKNSNQSPISSSNLYLASALSRLQSSGHSTAILGIRPVGPDEQNLSDYCSITVFAISDPIRKEASETLAALRSRGISIHMCTGDNPQTARAVAFSLSISPTHIRAGVTPEGKAAYIKELQVSSPNRKIVAFVGDGTNDTPALTVSDVSIALSHPDGSGSDIALTSSSFVLLTSNLASILKLVELSKRVFLRVKLNFMWAAVYNICLLPVAAGVFFPVGATRGANAHGGFRLSPVWASVAMAGSSVSVVLSSLALRLPEIRLKKL